MRARVFAVLACSSLMLGGCTAYVIAELSGEQGKSDALGGCFNLPQNQCGQCIATQCEAPMASPPVSLAAVCSFDNTSELVIDVTSCATDPRFANEYCGFVATDAGVYATSIDTQAAAENNLKHCISDHCTTSCSECQIPVTTCGEMQIPLADAGTCGACLDNAMNPPGAPCQKYVLQGGCYEDPSSPVAQCAAVSGQCTPADCSGLESPDTNLVDAGYAFFSCLWQQCQGSCPNP